jgi:hypothetical protein
MLPIIIGAELGFVDNRRNPLSPNGSPLHVNPTERRGGGALREKNTFDARRSAATVRWPGAAAGRRRKTCSEVWILAAGGSTARSGCRWGGPYLPGPINKVFVLASVYGLIFYFMEKQIGVYHKKIIRVSKWFFLAITMPLRIFRFQIYHWNTIEKMTVTCDEFAITH